jgi:hypothetical protein
MGICEHCNESLGYTRRGTFLNQLSDCNLIRGTIYLWPSERFCLCDEVIVTEQKALLNLYSDLRTKYPSYDSELPKQDSPAGCVLSMV